MIKLRQILAAALMLQAAFAVSANDYGIPTGIQQGNILHCYDWTFADIKAELPNIAAAGFGAVQVSPVQGNCSTNAEWFYAYMPYDIAFKANGNGTKSQLTSLCTEAHTYGIKIIVDIVANHINKASGYHATWWDSNGRIRWEGSVNYGSRYSITHGQLGDYGDVNSEDAEVQARAKAFVQDLKDCGVDGIRWDAAKHIGLPSESCNFWSTVTSVSGLWHYGEILDGPGGNKYTLLKEYTNYMTVTDTEYSDACLNAINGGNVPSGYGAWVTNGLADTKVIYWGESHDTYSNDGGKTKTVTQNKIDRAWALGACRNGATSLYLSRPAATERTAIRMGQKGSTHFTSAEIAAVNHLRNAAVGTEDYYTGASGVASITRKGIGACIVLGSGGNRQVEAANGGGYVPAGTYTDEVSGNTFTVTATTISGKVGSTGIAVIYKGSTHTGGTDPEPQPDPDGNYTIYWDNSATKWTDVYTWVWDDNHNAQNYTGGTWPGTKIAKDSATGYHKFEFTCTVSDPALMCIFNAGSDKLKTDDFILYNRGIYNMNGFTGQYVSAVSDISIDSAAAPVTYYTLQGIQVEQPTEAGIYIVRRGNSVTKQYIH